MQTFFFCRNFFFINFVKKYFCHRIESFFSTDWLECLVCVREGVHSCQYQGLVGPKGSECCGVLVRMVDNGTDQTLQRKFPVHVDKLPCGRQPVCHCMPHASHYSSPYHHHSSTRPLSLPLLQPSPILHMETAHWHRIPHPGHHDTHSTHCHCKTRKCNS